MRHFLKIRSRGKLQKLAIVTLLTLASSTNIAQTLESPPKETSSFWDDVRSNHVIQVGGDTWKLNKNLGPAGIFDSNRALNLADSQPHGEYKSTSPWVKIDAEARQGNAIFRLRYDKNQSVGSRIDELSADISRYDLGIRAGVLSYKVSWCRTQDVDSPWMRENDPFCVVDTTSAAIKSAPGVQAYLNTLVGSYKVQSLVGVYRPMLGNFNTQEFSEYVDPSLQVIGNKKYGASINAIDLNTGTEVRLSYLHSDQMANATLPNEPTQRLDQRTDVLYAAISTYITPLLNLRLSHFKSKAHVDYRYPTGFVKPGDLYPDLFDTLGRERNSKVLELNYQHTARDVISFAYSRYDLFDTYQSIRQETPLGDLRYSTPTTIKYNNTSQSIAWRRDWQKNIFTILQATSAHLKQPLSDSATTSYTHSSGRALGLRLGYSF
jgi:hypothetical protein